MRFQFRSLELRRDRNQKRGEVEARSRIRVCEGELKGREMVENEKERGYGLVERLKTLTAIDVAVVKLRLSLSRLSLALDSLSPLFLFFCASVSAWAFDKGEK